MPQQVENRPVFARVYTGFMGPGLDRAGIAEHRQRLLAPLSGTVLEVGAGYGANFAYYPPAVQQVIAVEPEPRLRNTAKRAAAEATVKITVVDGVAEALPAADAEIDTVVACLTLCTVPDQIKALAEIRRVLKPAGTLRFLEHVQADTPAMRRLQRIVDATIWPTLMGGCHTGRDTLTALEASGFELAELDRFPFPDTTFPNPGATHVFGTATITGRQS